MGAESVLAGPALVPRAPPHWPRLSPLVRPALLVSRAPVSLTHPPTSSSHSFSPPRALHFTF
eukprot:268557-Rhodomonas_salina.3